MAVKPTFCSICHRSVYVGHFDSLSCPVCASPLLESVTMDEEGQ